MQLPLISRCAVTSDPLVPHDHEIAVSSPRAGAIVTFVGAVRDRDHGRSVSSLSYEAHPDAHQVLAEVIDRHAQTSLASAIAVSHRIGTLKIGDAALVVSVASEHRAEAFSECARIVDEVKEHLPVWKHQIFADGTDEWVNCA